MDILKKRKDNLIPKWHVWYTKPRAEKKVLERLVSREIETFLPIRKELRKWSDRKKWVETPLFSGYIFTKTNLKQSEVVQFTEGILAPVRFEGKPAVIPVVQIEHIQRLLADAEDLEVSDLFLVKGDKIIISHGPLMGIDGIMMDYKGKQKLVIQLEQFGKSLLIEMPRNFVSRAA